MKTVYLLIAFQAALVALPTSTPASPPMLPRQYSTGIALVRQGQPCTIVYPAGQPWRKQAERLAASINRLAGSRLAGAEVPLIADTQAIPARLAPFPADLRTKPLIILGSLNTNRAIFPLYANYYTYCDAMYPGEDGSLLQTIVRPFGGPNNFLIVGGSLAGVERGVDVLIRNLDKLPVGSDVELPYCLDVELGRHMTDRIRPAIESTAQMKAPPTSDSKDSLDYNQARDAFTTCAHLYFYTGSLDIARQAKAWALYLVKREPRAFRTNDYTMETLAAAWRRLSPAPVFTADELTLIDNCIFQTAANQNRAWWRQKGAIPEIGGRHHSTGMFSWWELIRCLLELGRPDTAARDDLTQWQGECKGYLDGLLRHYWDDLDDYQSADSVQNTCSYALQAGKLEWFHDGMARRAAEKLLALTDNQGWYVGVQGYGEALPGWERFKLNGGLLLGACGFVYEDISYRALMDVFPALRNSWGELQPWGLHQFDAGIDTTASKPPAWFTGLNVLRLSPYRLDLMNKGVFLDSPLMDGFAVEGIKPPGIPADLVYDKVVYRSQPPGPYLLLQGMSGIALSTIDMNSIVRYMDRGRIWLVHNTTRRSLFFKNAIYVSNGLNDEAVPAACELLAHADLDNVAMVSSRLPDYHGTAWTRNVIIVKGTTVAIDQVIADKPGKYTVSCNWRTPDWAEFGPGGWTSSQDGEDFHILPGEMVGTNSDRFAADDGATRPTVLREVRQFDARPGDALFFENVLYTSHGIKEIKRPAPGVILVRDKDKPESTALFAAGNHGLQLADLKTDATVICMSGDSISLLQASSFDFIGNKKLSSNTRENKQLIDQNVPGYLQKLWDSCKSRPSATPPTTAADTGPKPAWTHPGPSTRGRLIDGVRLTGLRNFKGSSLQTTDWILPALAAEPKLAPQRGSALTASTKSKSDLEPMLDPLENSEFSLHLPQEATISEIEIIGATGKEISKPMPTNRLEMELSFSSDAFEKDIRKSKAGVNSQTTWHNLYKGHAYAFETYRIKGLNEPATEVRVRIVKPSGRMPLNEVRIRTKTSAGRQTVQTRVIDLDGDGNDELLAWTPEGEFCCLHADGNEMWRRDFGTGIITVDAWDLENDGRKEVFVSLTNWKIFCFNLDAAKRWDIDWSDMYDRTDGKAFGDGSLVYGIGVWQPSSASNKEIILTSYFCTSRVDARGQYIENYPRYGHNTQIRPIPDGLPYAGGLVTRSDIPWNGAVPIEWLDPNTGKPAARRDVPNGPSVLLEVGDFTGRKQAEVLMSAEQGIGVYAPGKDKPIWEHLTEAALTGAAAIRASEPGKPSLIVYGRQDGYLFVVSADGRLLHQLLLDEPIHCLTALRNRNGKPVAIVGTLYDLRCINLDDMREQWRTPGKYQTVATLKNGQDLNVIAVQGNGAIDQFVP